VLSTPGTRAAIDRFTKHKHRVRANYEEIYMVRFFITKIYSDKSSMHIYVMMMNRNLVIGPLRIYARVGPNEGFVALSRPVIAKMNTTRATKKK
jgi:hypothetical protein